jgi:hypothetical protein
MVKVTRLLLALLMVSFWAPAFAAEDSLLSWRTGGSCNLQSPVSTEGPRFVLTTSSSFSSKGERRLRVRFQVYVTDRGIPAVEKLEDAVLFIGPTSWTGLKGAIRTENATTIATVDVADSPALILARIKAANTLRLQLPTGETFAVSLAGSAANSGPYERCLAALPA